MIHKSWHSVLLMIISTELYTVIWTGILMVSEYLNLDMQILIHNVILSKWSTNQLESVLMQ